MDSELKKIKAAGKLAEHNATKEIVLGILGNPVILLVGGVATLEYLERQGHIGNVIATTTEVGLIGVCTAQALAPLAPSIGEGFAALTPLLGALGIATAIPGVPPPP